MSLRVRRRRTQPDQRTNGPKKLISIWNRKKAQVRGEIKTTRLEFSPTKDGQSASAAARGTVNKLPLYVTTHRRTRLTKRRSFSLNMPLRSQCLFRRMKYKRCVSSKITNDGTTHKCCKLQISQICVETPPLKKKGPLHFLYKLYIFQHIPTSLLRGDAHSRHHTDINRAQPSDVLNTKRSSLSLVLPFLLALSHVAVESFGGGCSGNVPSCVEDLSAGSAA